MKLKYLALLPVVLWSCQKKDNKLTPLPVTPLVNTEYIDSFAGEYSYFYHFDNVDLGYSFDTFVVIPLTVCVHRDTTDSIRIYDNLGQHDYSYTNSGHSGTGHIYGFSSTTFFKNDSNKYMQPDPGYFGSYYVAIRSDSLLYSLDPYLIGYKGGGTHTTIRVTFRGKK